MEKKKKSSRELVNICRYAVGSKAITFQGHVKESEYRERTALRDTGRIIGIEQINQLSLDNDCKSFFLEYRGVAVHEVCEGTEIFLIQKRDSDLGL